MIAARQIAFGKGASKGISAKSYVQDGLVAMWDGIENAGWGVHDESAMTWVDLSPSGCDMTNQQGEFSDGFRWLDNCFLQTDTSERRFFGRIGNIPQVIVDAVNSGDITVEGVQKHLRSGDAGCLLSQLEGTKNRFSILSPVFGGKAAFMEPWVTYSVDYGLTKDTAPLIAVAPAYVCVRKTSGGVVSSRCIVGGGVYDATGTVGNDVGMIADGRLAIASMGASVFWNARATASGIYAVRVYNRALTAEEIAYNYNIDKARFGL